MDAGTILNHYEILEPLGQGGMGQVYIAQDKRLNRKVALKVLPADMAEDEDRLKRFEREARAVAALNHPNIVTIYSVEEDQGLHFLTMELVEGKTLDKIVPAKGLGIKKFFELAIQVADALSAAHEKGITHRDLKPANLMVDRRGRMKILDFGLAKLAPTHAEESAADEVTQTLTRDGHVLGTVPYMSPEQVQGKAFDHRTDIFSLGIILYEMATGERPFRGETPADLISSILRDTPPALTEVKADYPYHLSRILKRCLEKEPERRFQTALDLRNDLEDLKREIETSDLVETFSEMSGTRPAFKLKAGKLPRWSLLAAAGAALLVLGLTVVLVLRRGTPPPARETGTEMIVVLPFEDLGPPADPYFTEGLTEEINSRLAAVDGFETLSQDTAEAYVRSALTSREIGEEAGVDYVLQGSVRWDRRDEGEPPRTRMTLQLIRTADDVQTWSHTYDRILDNTLGVQAEIAGTVVREIGMNLLGSEAELPPPPPATLPSEEVAAGGASGVATPPPRIAEQRSEATGTVPRRSAAKGSAVPEPQRSAAAETARQPASEPAVEEAETAATEAGAAPVPGAAVAEADLVIRFEGGKAQGVVTIYADRAQLLRQEFGGGGLLRRMSRKGRSKTQLEASFERRARLPVTTRELRIYLSLDGGQPEVRTVEPNFAVNKVSVLEIKVGKGKRFEVMYGSGPSE